MIYHETEIKILGYIVICYQFPFSDDEDEGENQSDDGDAPGAEEAAAQQKKVGKL